MNELGNISIRALLIFIDVYETQNFSVVARREGISASQVSRVIHQMEDVLGQQLFYRNTRAIIPTESGHLFIRYARAMTGSMEEARRELNERTLEPSGMVRINAPVFFGQRHVAPALPGLTARYPKLSIELTLTDDYIDPHREPADVIFRISVLTDSAFHARVFGQQCYHLAASPDYIRRHGEEWVHYPVSPLMSSNNAETLLIAALGGMGIVLFPDWLIGDRLKSGELIELLPELDRSIKTEPQHIAAIYPNARHPPLNVRAIIDYYIDAFGSPLYWQSE